MRLLSPTENHPAHVYVDVKVPAEYWGEKPQQGQWRRVEINEV